MNKNRVSIFAHRGANREAAENTLAAFDKACAYAIDGIETDVQLTRDEVAVLWHDRFLDKLGLPGRYIDDYDLSQLQAMNVAAHFGPGIVAESIVCLRDFIGRYRDRCRLLIEIKNRDWEPVQRHRIKLQQTLSLLGSVSDDRVMVSSFDFASLVYADQLQANVPLVYNLENDQTLADIRNILRRHDFLYGLCLPVEILDQALVDVARNHGKRIAVYTCNSIEAINKALSLRVDILISDVPQLALRLRDA
ncbi:MAG: glycerophosphodiester phosphodiesterase [Methylococcaceae bacterium]|nr:MAG: glycerophosphodiester phosphodiesterase [Methylococcaceae bacterium]